MSKASEFESSHCQTISNYAPSLVTSNLFDRVGKELISKGMNCKAVFAYSKSAFDMFDAIIDGGDEPVDYSRNVFILELKCNKLKDAIINNYNVEPNQVILPPECNVMPETNPGRYHYTRSELIRYYDFLTNNLGCEKPHSICGESLDAFSFSVS